MKLSKVIAKLEENPNKKIISDRDWREVKGPVTWQQAIQAWIDGKSIYCILGNEIYEYASHEILSDEDCFGVGKDELVLGKWYIED